MTHLLEITNLSIAFQPGNFTVVRDLSLSLTGGQVIGLVGESGSGKSISALSIMGLLPGGAVQQSGEIFFKGQPLSALPPRRRRELRGRHMGMIFQEPLTALNPVLTIGEQVAEIYRGRMGYGRHKAWMEAVKLLGRVGLPNPDYAAQSYPHRFSGGMRQRVVIALALALKPEIIIADEPTTALDPTIAAQIMVLLRRLAAEDGSAVLFITHNLKLLSGLANRVLVMYAGLVMEDAPVAVIFKTPFHPYTQGLLKALPPSMDEPLTGRLTAISGQPLKPGETFTGCPFAPRCPHVFDMCLHRLPPLTLKRCGSQARCFLEGA